MKDRIRQLMENQHMTQQTFSEFIGISSASLSSLFNGRTNPTLNTVEALRRKFPQISLDWLMYGKGPMFKDENPDAEASDSAPQSRPDEGMLDFSASSSAPSTPVAPLFKDGVNHTIKKTQSAELKYPDKPQRQITEIRIFYSDQTWETFVPKK